MTQTSNRFFDEAARLMNDAAGVAQGVRREFDTLVRTQAERILSDLDVVRRDEFEAFKEMARLAREENEALKARIAALEAKLGASKTRVNALMAPHRVRGTNRAPISPVSLFLTPGAAIQPPVRDSSTPGGCRGRNQQIHAETQVLGSERFSHGDRQGNQGDGAFAGRQGGRPV
jgi:BMFP domain-containing protein YqiC